MYIILSLFFVSSFYFYKNKKKPKIIYSLLSFVFYLYFCFFLFAITFNYFFEFSYFKYSIFYLIFLLFIFYIVYYKKVNIFTKYIKFNLIISGALILFFYLFTEIKEISFKTTPFSFLLITFF